MKPHDSGQLYLRIVCYDLVGQLEASGAFCWQGFTLIPAWISNYVPSKVWDEVTYPFLWISNFLPHILMDVITYPCWDLSYSMSLKGLQAVRGQATMA